MTQVLNDTFTDTVGTALTAHVSDSGHTWAPLYGDATGNGRINTYGGFSVGESSNGDIFYVSSAVIGTADVSVTFTGMLANVPLGASNNIGALARVSRLFLLGTDGQPADGVAGYIAFYDYNDSLWHLRRYNSPGSNNRNVQTQLATSAINPIDKTADTTLRTFIFTVTGVGASVRCLLKEGSTTIIDFSDTSADRIVAEGKVGASMGAYNGGNSGRMDSIQASSVVAVDTTAPTLTSPTGTASSTVTTTATGAVSTDEGAGTLWRLASANATETAATIKAAGLTTTVTATGVQNVTFTGLTAGATYYAHYVQDDAAPSPGPNTSTAVHSASFTQGVVTVTSVTVSPSTATVSGGGTQTFTATVAGAYSPSQAVNWSANAGSITSAGVFTAPASTGSPQSVTVTASSVVDGSKTGTATVTVPATGSTVTGVTVSPSTATVTGGATQTFTATVAGTGSPSQAVAWTTNAGSITSGGVLTAPATTGSVQTVTVTATSAQDGTKAGTATVTVPATTTVTFTPTLPLKYAVGGGLRNGVAVRVSVLNRTTDIPIVTVASITTHATTAVPPAFSVAGPVAGTVYPVKMTNLADPTDYAVFNLAPT